MVFFPKSFLDLQEEGPEKKPKILTAADKKWLKSLIVYEDSDMVVLNKPPGIAVQSGTKQTKSLDALMTLYFEDCKPRLVHRLDRDTSGVLVMAKTLPMARWITQAFKERTIQKIYWALVCGVPKKKEGGFKLSQKTGPNGESPCGSGRGCARNYYRIIKTLGDMAQLAPKTGQHISYGFIVLKD
jgi:23S rRNA pseudouridine955/2504/2580 synthase